MCTTIVSGKSLLGTRRFVAIGRIFPLSLVTVFPFVSKLANTADLHQEYQKQRRYRIKRLQDY